MIKVTLPDVLPEDIQAWKKKSEDFTALILAEADLAERHKLIDKHKNHWRAPELIEWLSDINFEKCWYTETKFGGDYQEVEHYRPKKGTKNRDGKDHLTHSGYYWLAFELSNYRLCKSRPNRKKGTFFPIVDERFRANSNAESWRDERPFFLDPLKSADVLLLSFDDNGIPVARDGIHETDISRVKFTIDKYFLDERVLNLRRRETWQASRILYYSYLNATKEANDTNSVALLTKAEVELGKLKAMFAPEAEFSSVAKESLMKLGEGMATTIACGAI
jgi:hypothetical protein